MDGSYSDIVGDDGLRAATPNCDRCLVPLEPRDKPLSWVCPQCGLVQL